MTSKIEICYNSIIQRWVRNLSLDLPFFYRFFSFMSDFAEIWQRVVLGPLKMQKVF